VAGSEFDAGAPTPPRQAAGVIVVRDGEQGLEVMLLKRSPHASFMAGVWVFPGGALEQEAEAGGSDAAAEDSAHRAAAVRELREEAGLDLAGSEQLLVEFLRWITPAQLSIRFDARFYLARLPAGQKPQPDGEECVDLRWLRPREALALARNGELPLAFPTIKHLEQLSPYATVEELFEYSRGRAVLPIEPRARLSGDSAQILLPGEPGYDELA
jgi:8-oxo-dGTP pyrophosphatase MutT (NUDIX family)